VEVQDFSRTKKTTTGGGIGSNLGRGPKTEIRDGWLRARKKAICLEAFSRYCPNIQKIKTKSERGLREISKQVETTSSKQDFVPKQFLKGL
jgi:hypothetical protein